ncbi:MAG: TIR domain-containing protein [Gemmatimonadota bacterium]|nr:TIR domain-containing protein [Gemmatimonadota bacterium]
MKYSPCPIWNITAPEESEGDRDGKLMNSPRAGGRYFITRTAIACLTQLDERGKARLTSWLVDQRQLGVKCPEIDSNTITTAKQRQNLSVLERADRLLQYIEDQTVEIGTEFVFTPKEMLTTAIGAWSESLSQEEVQYLLNYLDKQGWIALQEYPPSKYKIVVGYTLTVKGYARLVELEKANAESTKGSDTAYLNTRRHARMAETDEFEYDIALSFAGEDRAVVERIATELKNRGIHVFYDKFERAALWGKTLYEHLADLYSKRAKFCVIFVSQSYKDKLWTRHERQAAQERAFKENREYILPVRLDDTELPGLHSTVGYLDLREVSEQEIIDSAIEKVLEFNRSEEPRHREVHVGDNERMVKSLLSISCNPKVDGSLSDLQKSANKASFGVEFPRDYGIVIECPFSLASHQSRVPRGLVSRHLIPTQMKPYSGMQCEEELSLHTDGSMSLTYAYTFDSDTEPNFVLELYIKQLVYALHFYERMLAATNVETETAAIRTEVIIPDGAFLFDQHCPVDTEMQPAYYVGNGVATKEILVGMSGAAFQEDTADLMKRLSNGVLDNFEFDRGRASKGIPGLESKVIEHVVSVIQSHMYIKG